MASPNINSEEVYRVLESPDSTPEDKIHAVREHLKAVIVFFEEADDVFNTIQEAYRMFSHADFELALEAGVRVLSDEHEAQFARKMAELDARKAKIDEYSADLKILKAQFETWKELQAKYYRNSQGPGYKWIPAELITKRRFHGARKNYMDMRADFNGKWADLEANMV